MTEYVSKTKFLKIILPPLLAVGLFVATVFGYLLPNHKASLVDQQKNMLNQLVNTAWTMLAVAEKEVEIGIVSQQDAQKNVLEHLRGMRYGENNLDYFWINDLQPNMIMHPYRPDLEGKDVSDFRDLDGKSLFKEFAEVAKKEGEGFVSYQWQWKNDPTRTEPKLSFVKIFRPWGWVIGTGIYLNDVNLKIAQLSRKLMLISGAIIFLVSLLTCYMTLESLRASRKRLKAEAELKDHQDQLEHLVEERTAELSQEITERKKLETELQRITITDELTGLYNRRGFFELAQKQLQVASRKNNDLFLLYLDLDNMKQINDKFGHEMGDRALVETAEILKRVFRESDIISRLGGDEFVALLLEVPDEENEQTVITRLQGQLQTANSKAARPYQLYLSTGVGHYKHKKPCSLEEILSAADNQMYEQKKMKAKDLSS
ncbi:MAG: cache domain-containing protein [Proteobacteria bacterium]|nr:cache domain-containing protein [Pseudomonadota bacterium]MBU1639276.1 cache domain-containing protein [Pseudomonadota bacterium]